MREGLGSVVSAVSLVLAACASTPSAGSGPASTSPLRGAPTTLAAVLAIYRDSTPLPRELPRCQLAEVTPGKDSVTTGGVNGGLLLQVPPGWRALSPRAPRFGPPETVLEDSAGSRISIRPAPYRTGRPFFAKQAAKGPAVELPHSGPCQVGAGPAGSIWTLYPPDPGAPPGRFAAYNATGDLITAAGKRYQILLTAPTAQELDRIVRLVALARDAPLERRAPPGPCPRTGTTMVISGSVHDTSGVPLPGAQVYLNSPPLVSTTDAKGQYELTVPVGPIELRARLIGYHPRALSTCADWRAGKIIVINFELELAPGMVVH